MTTTELRLIPYLQYCLVNDQNIDPNKVNQDERLILSKWRNRGYFSGGASNFTLLDKRFWDFMSSILFYAYVDYENQQAVKCSIRDDANVDL